MPIMTAVTVDADDLLVQRRRRPHLAPVTDPLAEAAAVLDLVRQVLDGVVRVSPLAEAGRVLVVDTSALHEGGSRVVFCHADDADRVRAAAAAALFGGTARPDFRRPERP